MDSMVVGSTTVGYTVTGSIVAGITVEDSTMGIVDTERISG